jgi:hypothetical protein
MTEAAKLLGVPIRLAPDQNWLPSYRAGCYRRIASNTGRRPRVEAGENGYGSEMSGLETLHRSPRLDQSVINPQITKRHQLPNARLGQEGGGKLGCYAWSSKQSRFLENTVASHAG